MASIRIIHFGTDDCHRVSVLRSAGYRVEDCRSLHTFGEALTADGELDAVFITEREGDLQGEAISLAQTRSSAPLVLFRRSHSDLSGGNFDLVIDSLTSPQNWLEEIGQLIARSQSEKNGRPGSRTTDSGAGSAAFDL